MCARAASAALLIHRPRTESPPMSMLLSPALVCWCPMPNHRDRRNIATHVVGVPLVVVAAQRAAAHPAIEWRAGGRAGVG